MKNIYSQVYGCVFAFVFLLGTFTLAHSQSWAPASPVTVCPGQTGTYTLSNIPTGSRIKAGNNPAAVSGGTLTNSPALSNNTIAFTVLWDDTPNGGRITVNIEVPVRNSSGTITGYNDIGNPLIARIRSVAGQPVPSGTLAVPFCSTSAFTLTLPAENFPNVPDEPIPAYLWEVPASWTVQGATLITSFVTTPGNFKLYQGTHTITLTPTPGGDVDLRTFKYSSACNQTYYPS